MAPSNPDDFDGYRKWLGIANKKRPPTHYELLAISLDEDDPEVIRAAAEQRRHYVETKRGDGHDSVVNEILYRIGEAEATLLNNDEMRRDYDRQLNLFEKRRKNRQVDPFASPSRIRSQPGKTVGEDSGIVKTFVGIMAVICVGFGGMAWFSFGLPWSKPALQAEPAVAPAAPPVQLVQKPEPAIAQPEPVKEAEPIKLATEQTPDTPESPPAQLAPESAAHWKFWDVFGKGAKKESLIVSRDGMLLSPAHEQAFCLTSAKELSGLDLKLEFQFQTADGLANPYVGVVSTLPNPAASDWKQQIPRSVQIKLDPKVAGELVLPTADFKVKLNEVQKIHNARHIAPINKAEVKIREWNTLEVKCSEDSKLIVKINGVTVNRLEGMQTNKGHVVIWPSNAEMRLRNAVVVVDGSETKLSFENLDDSHVAAKAPEAAESKLAFSAVTISIAKDGSGKLIVDSREPNEIKAEESKGKPIKIAALGDAKVASEEDGRLRVLYDFSEFNALDQLKAPSMNPDEVTLFKQVSIDADEKALVFNPGSLGKVRLRFHRPVRGSVDMNVLLKGASEGVVQLQFGNGQEVLIVSLHGKNSPEKEATGTVIVAMKTGNNLAPLLRANQPIAQRKEFDFKVKPAWSQQRTAILVAYQGDVPIAIPRLEVTAKMIPSFGIALAQKGKRVIAEKILDDSAGAAAGIKAGDTILKINGKASDDVAGAMKLLGESTLDKDAVFEIERFGKKQTINVTPK